DKPWGWEEIFTPHDSPYTGKILHIEAGRKLSLQAHLGDISQEGGKIETLRLEAGRCLYVSEDSEGMLSETEMESGKGYTVQPGQKHRLVGITDCRVFEVSTPESGRTRRFEDDYKRADETKEMRKEPNRGWGNPDVK
ncbi:MAG TPA: hypothetical protein VJB06_02465, partial [archaeon]|nr:hypothetical protein [archaeon]